LPLFWIVHDLDDARREFIQDASALIFARLRASIAGFTGEFIEAHELDAKRAKKVPARMIGRRLTAKRRPSRLIESGEPGASIRPAVLDRMR
jgi:hypothetical protein